MFAGMRDGNMGEPVQLGVLNTWLAGRWTPATTRWFESFLRANTRKQPCYCSRGQGIRLSSALIWDWFWFGGVLIRGERSQTANAARLTHRMTKICASDDQKFELVLKSGEAPVYADCFTAEQ